MHRNPAHGPCHNAATAHTYQASLAPKRPCQCMSDNQDVIAYHFHCRMSSSPGSPGVSAAAAAWKARQHHRIAAMSQSMDKPVDRGVASAGAGSGSSPAATPTTLLSSPSRGVAAAAAGATATLRTPRSPLTSQRIDDRSGVVTLVPPPPPPLTTALAKTRPRVKSAFRLHVQVALDCTVGMAGGKLDAAKAGIAAMDTHALQDMDAMGVVAFHSSLTALHRLTDGQRDGDVAASLPGTTVRAGCRLWDAMLFGLDELEAMRPTQEVFSELVRGL